jgi:KaiC/GvpD/RAD55 family RecA-like ATPase
MAFAKAERTNLYLRCALFGPSGSGKTMTGLRMAKGISDKMGVPYAVIDTESRSASKYADRFDFEVDNLKNKTIDHYLASMEEAKKAGYKVLLIDSLTHAWKELTEEVDRIAQSSKSKNNFTPWAQVSPKQERLIKAILNYPGHVIATMRSKTEWVIGTGKDGKIAPEKVGLAPVQGKGIEYEFDLLIEFDQHHVATVTKDRTGKFQDEAIEKPGEDFGVALYEWLASGKA